MLSQAELNEYYKSLSDDQLLNLVHEGGFTDEAKVVLENELARRKLSHSNVKKFIEDCERSKLDKEVIEKEVGLGYGGLGLHFYGRNYLNVTDKEANIQLRTKWFTLIWIPLIPIASYRFQGSSQRVIERVPLNWTQVLMIWSKTATIVLCVILAFLLLGHIGRC